MGLLLLLLLVILAISAYLWYRQMTGAPPQAHPPSNRFHAVTIHFDQHACPAVRSLANAKFLAKEAPRLPLDDCSALHCQCRYEHYDDRRAEERREAAAKAKYEGNQRRTRQDRRRRA